MNYTDFERFIAPKKFVNANGDTMEFTFFEKDREPKGGFVNWYNKELDSTGNRPYTVIIDDYIIHFNIKGNGDYIFAYEMDNTGFGKFQLSSNGVLTHDFIRIVV
jgi:hypothetical protein